MDPQQHHYLHAMGIDLFEEAPFESETSIEQLDWEPLIERVKGCQACSLHKTRKQVVFGVGNRQADLLLVGEAPGAQEDQQGEPFVGRAGQLLTSMLHAIDLRREDIFIANILKCRPPNNRDPSPEEVALCTPFLVQQVNLIKPKLIVALGRIAAHFLLNTQTPLSRLRGQLFNFGHEEKIPLIVTFHPAYLLRSPREKEKAYDDLLRIRQILAL